MENLGSVTASGGGKREELAFMPILQTKTSASREGTTGEFLKASALRYSSHENVHQMVTSAEGEGEEKVPQ